MINWLRWMTLTCHYVISIISPVQPVRALGLSHCSHSFLCSTHSNPCCLCGSSQHRHRVCSTYAACSLRLGGFWYPYWCRKPTLELHGKTNLLWGWRAWVCVSICVWVACSINWTRATKHIDRQTDDKNPLFLLLPLVSSVYVLFSAAPLFCCSLSEMRHKTPRFVVCLPLTSVCLYSVLLAPPSLPLLISFALSVLPCSYLCSFLSPLCPVSPCFLTCALFFFSFHDSFHVFLPLCQSGSLLLLWCQLNPTISFLCTCHNFTAFL